MSKADMDRKFIRGAQKKYNSTIFEQDLKVRVQGIVRGLAKHRGEVAPLHSYSQIARWQKKEAEAGRI